MGSRPKKGICVWDETLERMAPKKIEASSKKGKKKKKFGGGARKRKTEQLFGKKKKATAGTNGKGSSQMHLSAERASFGDTPFRRKKKKRKKKKKKTPQMGREGRGSSGEW